MLRFLMVSVVLISINFYSFTLPIKCGITYKIV